MRLIDLENEMRYRLGSGSLALSPHTDEVTLLVNGYAYVFSGQQVAAAKDVDELLEEAGLRTLRVKRKAARGFTAQDMVLFTPQQPSPLTRLVQQLRESAAAQTLRFEWLVEGDMAEAQAASVAVEYVGTYLATKAKIAELEAVADEARAAIVEALGVDGAEPGQVWPFEGLGTVSIVKGRVSEKLDRAKLARAGVAAEVLDAATVRTEGKPSMRVTPWEEPADAEV